MANNTYSGPINIVIPMAGKGQRFKDKGYSTLKPFLPLPDRTNPKYQYFMIQEICANCKPYSLHDKVFFAGYQNYVKEEMSSRTILIYDSNNIEDHQLDSLRGFSDIRVSTKGRPQQGQAWTTLLAKEHINNDNPLIIANSDQLVLDGIDTFGKLVQKGMGADGAVMLFHNNDPKWSYAAVDKGEIIEVAEKRAISEHATVGVYFWTKGSDFVKYAEEMIVDDERVNGEFYCAPAYNRAIRDGKKILPFWVNEMVPLGTPEDYERYLAGHKCS